MCGWWEEVRLLEENVKTLEISIFDNKCPWEVKVNS